MLIVRTLGLEILVADHPSGDLFRPALGDLKQSLGSVQNSHAPPQTRPEDICLADSDLAFPDSIEHVVTRGENAEVRPRPHEQKSSSPNPVNDDLDERAGDSSGTSEPSASPFRCLFRVVSTLRDVRAVLSLAHDV